jgi:hypothetical protein
VLFDSRRFITAARVFYFGKNMPRRKSKLREWPWMKLYFSSFSLSMIGKTDSEIVSMIKNTIIAWNNDDYNSLPEWAKISADEIRERTEIYAKNRSNKNTQLYSIENNCTQLPISSSLSEKSNDNILDKDINSSLEGGTGGSKKDKIPPSIDEVKKYCDERKNKIDPQNFIDYYETRGWMVGKVKMKSWRAAIRTWEKNEGKHSINQNKGRTMYEFEKNAASKYDNLQISQITSI